MQPEKQILQISKKLKGLLVIMPVIVGNEALNFTLDNFRRQGFLGHTFLPWLPRKQGWKKNRRTKRGILINSGRLRRSVRILRSSPEVIVIGTDVIYAKAHNEGLRIGNIQTVKGFQRKNGSLVKQHSRRINQRIPKRQFIGNSPYLDARIKRIVNVEFMKATK